MVGKSVAYWGKAAVAAVRASRCWNAASFGKNCSWLQRARAWCAGRRKDGSLTRRWSEPDSNLRSR